VGLTTVRAQRDKRRGESEQDNLHGELVTRSSEAIHSCDEVMKVTWFEVWPLDAGET
jgi:hypothetical protein